VPVVWRTGGRARLTSALVLENGRTVLSLSSSITRRARCSTVEVLLSVGIDAEACEGVARLDGDSLAEVFPGEFPLKASILVRLASRRLKTLDAVLSSGS